MNYSRSRFPTGDKGQRGINMVDLMMWLVIAALLLAAAIQGIGYYQKAANLYTMKSDAAGIGELTAAAASDRGTIGTAELATAKSNAKISGENVVATGIDSASGKPVIIVTHPAVADTDVAYFFEDTALYNPGVNVITKGSITPDAGTGTEGGSETGGTDTTGDGSGGDTTTGGDTGGGGTGQTVTTSLSTVSPLTVAMGNAEVKWAGSAGYLTEVSGPGDPDYWGTDPDYRAFNDAGNAASSQTEWIDDISYYRLAGWYHNNVMDRIDNAALNAARDAYYAADEGFWNDPNTETQKALVDATYDYYQLAVNTPFTVEPYIVADPAAPNLFGTQTVAAGTSGPVTFRFMLPDGAPEDSMLWQPYASGNTWNQITTTFGLNEGAGVPPAGTSNGKPYWELTMTPTNETFAAGTYEFYPQFKSNSTKIMNFGELTMVVQ